MAKQLEATLDALADVSSDVVGSLHHGLGVLSETVGDRVGHLFGEEPPPSHKGRWVSLLLVVGVVVAVLVVLRARQSATPEVDVERTFDA